MPRRMRTSMSSEASVWEQLNADAIRAVAKFLPLNLLTPKGVWHLMAVNRDTRDALKAWLEPFKRDVERTVKFCERVQRKPEELVEVVDLEDLHGDHLSYPDMCTFERIAPELLGSGVSTVQALNLRDVCLRDADMEELAFIARYGIIKAVQVLSLCGPSSSITDKGMKTLSSMVGSGALPDLVMLNLGDWHGENCIGNEGMKAFASLGGRALPKLRCLSISCNDIADEGMAALSTAIRAGAMPALNDLDLRCNPGHSEALVEACRERNICLLHGDV